ncbi:hypothetical protein HHI36_006706, partial [Cryptolaemus montrouzieri]
MANNFNKYLVYSIADILDSIKPSEHWENVNCYLYLPFDSFRRMSLAELRIFVNSMGDKSSASEILNSKVIKAIFETIAHVVLELINTSLDTGKIPEELKI